MIITVQYYTGKAKNKTLNTLKADRCHCEIPAYSDKFYWVFFLKGGRVGQIEENKLTSQSKKRAERLFGKYWRDKVRSAKKIILTRTDANRFEGLPQDTKRVWEVNYKSDIWLIECPNRCILHICNNPEKTALGSLQVAVKKLFRQSVSIYYPTVKVVTV